MLRKFLCLGMLALFAVPVQAGVFGSALITTTGMRVQRSTSPTGTFTNVTGAGLTVVSSTLFAVNTATLNGVDNQQFGSFPVPVPISDTVQAFITSGAETAPAENTFAQTVPIPATSAFARSDTLTTGSLVAPGGLNTYSVAEIEAADFSVGDSVSSSLGSSSIFLTVAQSGYYRLAFDATIDAVVNSIAPPANRLATASTALSIQVNGATVTLDDPSLVGVSLSGNADTGPLTFTGITTGAVFLSGNTLHSLSISQLSTASLAAVPEPGTLLAFAGLFAAGVLHRRRRHLS
ncbi:hypothetical protein K227x_46760 [Rubripirellula lacrimiformis]|uniref:PEP-CTERM protein-sorting domain-containing protein n=1 Tax=Rubripirellula lacrimiformis TaxID=1930273 RepID=A0A517NGK3_9BACT|nr:PEP-CTERM sorting domain-containing protein [Rubripirellula lacrimiformis]QDT06267.1 hypothetical protein K227x_46760 [Rubripirellula lacrimiformis]